MAETFEEAVYLNALERIVELHKRWTLWGEGPYDILESIGLVLAEVTDYNQYEEGN